jgi:hypothetical protein
MTDIDKIDCAAFDEQIIAIEFLFKRLPPNRLAALSQVFADNIDYTDLSQSLWLFGMDDGLISIKATHPPVACNMMSDDMEPMLKAIKRQAKSIVTRYNELCRTDIVYDSFKIHFDCPEWLLDCDDAALTSA